MSKYEKYAKDLLKKMTLEEKVAQLSQTVAGYRCYDRDGENFTFNDDFKSFIKNYGAMGAISNILRSCSWTKKDWGVGIEPKHRVKVANMLQKYAAENSRLGIPVLIEVEANHGLQALGSEMFPTNIGMGCMFNSNLYKKVMETVGKETFLSGNHIDFVTMFDIARDPRWGRVEEFFSEDPFLAAEYAQKGVEGLKKERILACCKHYCATGDCFGGINTAEVNIGPRELRDIYLPVVKNAIKSGADVIMAAYNTIDSIPCHANSYLLKEILRDELGFEGIILSDGFGVERMTEQMGLDKTEGSVVALKSGIDLSLADQGAFLHLIEGVNKGMVDINYIDEAVLRILSKKYELKLFDNPYIEDNGELEAYLSSGIQKKLSYSAAAESMVLLKNQSTLPITSKKHVALIGKHANNLYHLLGSYTSLRKSGEGKTILDAFKEKFDCVDYTCGWDFENNEDDFDNAVKIAEKADVIVITLGGTSASAISKTEFDKNTGAAISSKGFVDCGEGVDLANIELPGNQLKLLRKLRTLNKPIVSVLVQGRPYIITEAEKLSDAVIAAWYPGQQGAEALADILLGNINPSGKLSVSIPFAACTLPAYYNRIGESEIDNPFDECCSNTYTDYKQRVLHPFGFGLSYSEFKYSNLSVEKAAENSFVIELDVQNVSEIYGAEVVQLYIKGRKNTIRRRGKELKAFEKIYINSGETKRVSFTLGYDELKIYSAHNRYEVEAAEVEIMIGSNPCLPLRAVISTTAQYRECKKNTQGENI